MATAGIELSVLNIHCGLRSGELGGFVRLAQGGTIEAFQHNNHQYLDTIVLLTGIEG